MNKSFHQTLATTTTGAVLGLLALTPNAAQAAAIKFDFISTLDSTPNITLGTGILSYDSAPITGVGLETIQMNQLVGVQLDLEASAEFSFGGFTDGFSINESDVVPPSPDLTFQDGVLTGFTDIINTNSLTFGVPIRAQAFGTTFSAFATIPNSLPDSPPLEILVEQGDIVFSTVPEPGIILGLTFIGFGVLLKGKNLGRLN